MAGGILGAGPAINPFTGAPYNSNINTVNNNSGTVSSGVSQGPINGNNQPNNFLKNQYGVYNAGVKTNAEDYSNIMQGYNNLLHAPSSAQSATSQFTPWNPQQLSAPQQYRPQALSYTRNPDVDKSLGNLSELSNTGGYSESDIASLRARGTAPITSVYANAQRGIDRNRTLQGGYSPSYNAVTSKMAREMSDKISGATQNVNAGIAENVAKGRLNIAPQYASAAAHQGDIQNDIARENERNTNEANRFNANNVNDTNKFNTGIANEAGRYNVSTPYQMRLQGNQQDIERQLQALNGMRSIYGTTPALAQLFGNQALSSAEFQNLVNQQNRQPGLGLISGAMR